MRTRTAQQRASDNAWMAQWRAAQAKRVIPPEVLSRRKSRAGQVSAQMIRDGVYRVAVPGYPKDSPGRPPKQREL